MADNDAPKKPRGRPKKKKCGKKEAQNVPGKNLQKSQKERGRKRKNYLAKKGLCGGFDPGDKGGVTGVEIICTVTILNLFLIIIIITSIIITVSDIIIIFADMCPCGGETEDEDIIQGFAQ